MKRPRRPRTAIRWLALAPWLGPILISAALHGRALADSYDFSAFPKPAPVNHVMSETAEVKLGPNAAPWLRRFIGTRQAQQKIRWAPQRIALFRGEESISYLAVLWPTATWRTRLEFYKIANTYADDADLKPVRTLSPHSVTFNYPPALRTFRGEPPVAAMTVDWYGMGSDGNEKRLFLLTGNTVDITPDWAGPIVDVVDIDGDGQYEVVTSDNLWEYYYGTPARRKLRVPVVLKRSNGNFVPACREFAPIYRKWIDSQLASARSKRSSPFFRAEALTAALLGQVQIGALADARHTASALVNVIRAARQARHKTRNSDTDLGNYNPDAFRDSFRRLLKRAPRFANLPCVLEAGADNRYRRVERYRVLPD